MLSAKPPRPLCRRSELVHDWKARLGCDAGEGVGRSQSVIVVRDDLGVLEIFANQFESKAETAHKICGLAQKWQIGDWMGPPTLRSQGLDGLDGSTHSPVPRINGLDGSTHSPRIGWVHPLSGPKETWMVPLVPLAVSARRVPGSATTRLWTLSREYQGPRAVLNALERLADGYGSECGRVRQDLGIAESQLRDYQASLGKPFLHDAYLAELTGLRDQLKAGLPGATPEPGNEAGPSVSDLAEKIKALKAANNIEATPQRVRQKQSSAEEPVTARIRRKTEAHPASDPGIQVDAASGAVASPPLESPHNPSIHSSLTFQERIATQSKGRDEGPHLP